MSGVRPSTVSALPQPLTDSAFIADYGGERNYRFHTAIGSTEVPGKNTIAACVQGDQTVTDGQTVRLRLLEPMRVSGRTIPRNTTLVGTARLQGERLEIGIGSLEYQGNIIPVELAVYDSDGQAGIFVPGSMETDAAKEIGANMGSSLGSSINISTDAGAQLASASGKGSDTGSLAVYIEEDAHGKGASEIGIQGVAVSEKIDSKRRKEKTARGERKKNSQILSTTKSNVKMSIRKVMMMFALMTGIVCAGHAQEVKNDSTATTKAEELKLVKDVYPQTEEDGDLYHGLTKKLMFDRMIPPHGLEVTYDKTVHILFPSAVRYVDLGSPNLIAGKADGAENVIRVKATVRNFRMETNMSVITEDGSYYSFNVKYADEPLLLNVEMKDFIHDGSTVNRSNNAQEIYLKELGSESPMLVHLIMKSLHKENKRKVKHIGCKRFGIQYLLKGIYVHNDLLYLHTEIKNQSNVPFDVDYITFKIVDKKVAKRTAIQEQVLFPLRAYNYAVRVAGKKSERTVFCLQKFTIPDGKQLVVEMNEKNGGRHQTFVVENGDLVQAETINELRVR